jgi:hypothetical protein
VRVSCNRVQDTRGRIAMQGGCRNSLLFRGPIASGLDRSDMPWQSQAYGVGGHPRRDRLTLPPTFY